MFSNHSIDEEHQQDNVQNNNLVLQGQKVERRRISTVGNLYNFANSLTTTETTTPITTENPSIHSGYNKSVVASVSMSLERKDSIQYIVNPFSKFKSVLPSGLHPACIIPPGQNTVIHFDNYTKFMAQRVTTTRTDVQTSAEISNDIPTTNKQLGGEVTNQHHHHPTLTSSTCTSGSSELDIDVQVIFGGCSKNIINKKTLTMHKQKMMASKSLKTPSKIRNRKESLALDNYIMPPPAPTDKTIKKSAKGKIDSTNKPKALLNKPKKTRQKKAKEPKGTPNQKQTFQAKTLKQQLPADESLVLHMSRFTQTDATPPKILKPCVNLLQDKKCPQQLTCRYLHSDFPCKYYYYNLPCPDGTKCKFMHNGSLSPQLKSALQSHLVDLLSGGGKSPSETEYLFVQQMQNIEDLSVKLKEFQNKDLQASEVIELIDDDEDDDYVDQVLVIDESIGKVKINDTLKPVILSLNPLQNTTQPQWESSLHTHIPLSLNALQNTQLSQLESPHKNTPLSLNPLQNTQQNQQVLALVPTQNHKLDTEFKYFKEVNTVLANIEDKLEKLKKSNKSVEEKNKELIVIYELLMNQEKLLPQKPATIQENDSHNTRVVYQIPVEPISDDEGQPHIILVDPEIVHGIRTTNSPESLITLTDDEYSETRAIALDVSQANDVDVTEKLTPADVTTEKLTPAEATTEKLSPSDDVIACKDDDTLSSENVKSIENQEMPQLAYANLLEKESRATIENISTTIKDTIDGNNMTVCKISTIDNLNLSQTNMSETISKPLIALPEPDQSNNISPLCLSSEESRPDNEANKITNIPEEDEQIRESLTLQQTADKNETTIIIVKDLQYNIAEEDEQIRESLTLKQTDDKNDTTIDIVKDLQYNCENISNNAITSYEEITKSPSKISNINFQSVVEFIDDDSLIGVDKQGPQPSNGSNSLDEQTTEPNNVLQQQPVIENTENLKNISPDKNTNLSEQEYNKITLDRATALQDTFSCSVNREAQQQTNETRSKISNSISLTTSPPQEQQRPKDMNDYNIEQPQENCESPPSDETSTLELAISSDEKYHIEGNDDDESPPYEKITSTVKNALKEVAFPKTFPRALPRSRIRLRSHTVQDNEETDFKSSSQESEISTTIETHNPKPLKKFRRLRLPKPSKKAIAKSLSNECKIDAEIINKLIDVSHTEKPASSSPSLQDLEEPLTQNVIITNRFLKKAKAKLCQQMQQVEKVNETSLENMEKPIDDNKLNVELNMFALHNENFEVTICTQTSSDGTQSLNPSQDPLMDEKDDGHHSETNNHSIAIIQKTQENVETKSVLSLPMPNKIKKAIRLKRVSFEKSSSPPTSAAAPALAPAKQQQFILGNPHVVLTKLKPPLLPAISTQKQMQADSTTSNANNSIVVSSSTNSPTSTAAITICSSSTSVTLLSGDNKSSHVLDRKRRSFTPEYDLDSSLKADKLLKVTEQSSDKGDFNTDFSDEKPTKADTFQSSSSTDNERTFKPTTSTAHHVTTQQQHHHNMHLVEQQEQLENESDLRQQIENVSNKSDLQLQSQSHQLETKKEIETTITTSTKNSNDSPHIQQHQREQEQQYKQIEKEKIANTCNPFECNLQISAAAAVAHKDKTQQQSSPTATPSPKHMEVNDATKPTSISSNKYSNEAPISPAIFEENIKGDENTDLYKYSSLYNKLSLHTARRQINFENSSVNITPIASPTYVGGDNTIASPSPVKEDTSTFDIHLGGEIDGRMTYPPIRYMLHRIELGKSEINKPPCIDKLAKTTHLDPRIFRSHAKIMTFSQPITLTSQAGAGPIKYSTTNSALSSSSSLAAYQKTSMLPYDPRNRSTAMMSTPTSNQPALTCCNMNSTAELVPIGELQTPGVGVSLQHHHHHVPHQMPEQQTPNMLLYGCLQRSPWYQSLMSTMKIQINQSISQLVRALNNFQRERLINPNIVFDIFKIDIAAELLEIMRNLGIFVDANGMINEQRHVPTYAGRSCLGAATATAATIPVNATYSFIQQVLTPTTLGASMMTTASSSTYNAAAAGALNVNEPFVSCYIEAPKIVQLKHHHEEVAPQSPQDDNSSHNSSGGSYNNYNQRRSNNEFKKPYDNNNTQQRGSSYNQNSRFNRSYQNSESNSPARTSPQHHVSPREGGGSGGGSRGGGRVGGRYNNNNDRRFNNNNNSNSNYAGSSSRSTSSPPPPAQGNLFNNKNNRSYNSNNSPTKTSSPPQNYGQYRNSSLNINNSSSPTPSSSSSSFSHKPPTQQSQPDNDEEDWD